MSAATPPPPAHGLDWARAQDAADPLAPLRAQFALPCAANGEPLVYLCGHSLGLAPRAARRVVDEELDAWERLGVRGHEHAPRDWIRYAERLQPALGRLAGAAAAQVVAMNSLSVNLHLLLASFYRPTAARGAILIESGAFASDRYVVTSQLAWHGRDPSDLIELSPRHGEETLRIEDLEQCLAAQGERIALVLWPGVQYLTGQAFDVSRIARAAHAAGCLVGLDLAHAIGNVELALAADDIDFAAWCSYKYLNGGPGAIGGAFVHERHSDAAAASRPRLQGWWGHDLQQRFAMRHDFTPATGAAAWALSNPPILACAPLLASLPHFDEAGMPALRAKSRALTQYARTLVQAHCGPHVTIITPQDPDCGAQLSLRVNGGAGQGRRVFAQLEPHGVVTDWREPDIIRIAPVPLYNRFEDVWRGITALAAALAAAPRGA